MNQFNLTRIAEHLEGLEETIISKLIDRAQFRANAQVYKPGKSGFKNEQGRSLFALRLLFQERMDAQFGRFCVAEERPFNARLPLPKRTVNLPATGLGIDNFKCINLTKQILPCYMKLIPRICERGNDGHFGSSVEHDVYAIQAIARRIHYGALYVAESKYRASPDLYNSLAALNDTKGMTSELTRKEVEDRIVQRVRDKVVIAQSNVNRSVRRVVDPDILVAFYRDTIIPLTKAGEVLYLLNRRRSTHAEPGE